MFYVYVLRSLELDGYYIGYSSDTRARLRQHNSGIVSATQRGIPWEVFYTETTQTAKDAIRRERQLKSWKSRRAIERLKFGNKIEDPRPRPSRGRDQ